MDHDPYYIGLAFQLAISAPIVWFWWVLIRGARHEKFAMEAGILATIIALILLRGIWR